MADVARLRIPPLRVIVPMKPLDQAKSRLWTDVPTLMRNGVTLMMLDTVVRAAVSAIGPTAVQVVGGDDAVRQVTADAKAEWVEDPGRGLNGSLWTSIRKAFDDGCRAALFLPGDLPLIEADDVVEIAMASEEYSRPVGVRAHDGGTNALLVTAARPFEPRLGVESFAKHAVAAYEAHTFLKPLELRKVEFDVDSFEDFKWAREHIAGFNQRLYDWQARLHAAAAKEKA